MTYFAPKLFVISSPFCVHDQRLLRINPNFCNYPNFMLRKLDFHRMSVFSRVNEGEVNAVEDIEKPKLKRVRTIPNLSEEQKQAISQLPFKMTNRCKALMKRIICFSTENGSVSSMLAAWVKSTQPQRADWLSVLKELERLNHHMYFEVAEHALVEESFEANIRDYTKIIHGYAKQNKLQEAEHTLIAMKSKGFLCDQVTLTALIHMYSNAGNLKLAEDAFEEMKLLGVQLDKRSYGSMVMAYIRAGKLAAGESLLKEMEAVETYAGREVYKALLRAYSMMGDNRGAQRVFDATQLAERLQSRCHAMLSTEETSARRRFITGGAAVSLLGYLNLNCELTLLPALSEEKPNASEDKEEGVVGALKSLFNPNEKTKSGKVLPKAYLQSAREVVKTLRESLKEDSKDMAKFRRTADAAKESIRDYLNGWRGQTTVVNEESYVMLEKAIRTLAGFYSKAGPSAALPEDVRSEILSDLTTAEEAL